MDYNTLFIWKPSKSLMRELDLCILSDRKKAFKKFRNASSNYIKSPIIRLSILDKHNYQCVYCGAKKNIQIDHIKSVYRCFKDGDFLFCNSIENLQTLCGSCNAAKID